MRASNRARETHDPALLAQARDAEARALSLQDNFEALLAMAAIQNYAHRFEDAIRWGNRAAAAAVNAPYIPDPAVTAMLVEAYLGLGQVDEAGRLVPPPGTEAADFHSAASLGKWLAASGRADDAVRAYGRAADLARSAGASEAAGWAAAAAAGVLIETGQLPAARAHLETAAALDPRATSVRARRAQLNSAEGRLSDALAGYEAILIDDPDPVIAAQAYVAAARLGKTTAAARHFAAAERGFDSAIAAGEVYTLGPLAMLYADAGVHLDRALALAQENLRWKRDREAVNTLAAVRAQQSSRARPAAGRRGDCGGGPEAAPSGAPFSSLG